MYFSDILGDFQFNQPYEKFTNYASFLSKK